MDPTLKILLAIYGIGFLVQVATHPLQGWRASARVSIIIILFIVIYVAALVAFMNPDPAGQKPFLLESQSRLLSNITRIVQISVPAIAIWVWTSSWAFVIGMTARAVLIIARRTMSSPKVGFGA